jgi:hypothetical protein
MWSALRCLPLALLAVQEQAADPIETFQSFCKPINLDVKSVSAREVLRTIFEQSGETLEVPREWNPKELSLTLKNATFWQAIDEVCRLDGNIDIPSRLDSRSGLVAQPWSGRPICSVGPLRFCIQDVGRVREMQFPKRGDRTEITILVQWISQFTPVLDPWPCPGVIEIVRAEGSRGQTLLPPLKVDDHFVRSPGGTTDCKSMWMAHLQPTDRADKVISRLDAIWKTVVSTEVEKVVFDSPLQSEGQRRHFGPFALTLQAFKRDPKGGDSLEVKLVLEMDASRLTPEMRKSLESVPLRSRLLNKVDIDGRCVSADFNEAEGTEGQFKAVFRHFVEGSRIPQTITYRVAKRASLVAIPLSFGSIRLPE